MKSIIKIITIILTSLILNSCSSTPKITDIADIIGTEWILTEIKTKPQNIVLNRNNSEMKEIFTIRIDADRLSGIGAPNRYTAPYKFGENQTITVQAIAATLMAPIQEPSNLKESEYFNYLQNAYKWNSSKTKLQLYTKNANGVSAILIYSLNANK
jgi:heat shock protein HslJ